jgi:eukaryotic-like serine/threonine-protein kinase
MLPTAHFARAGELSDKREVVSTLELRCQEQAIEIGAASPKPKAQSGCLRRPAYTGAVAAPPKRIGRYEIIEPLARGGTDSVYLARDPRLDRLVALKLFSIDDHVLRVRHAREARSAAQLHHPNIETIFDVGEEKGLQFIAAEYIQGESLTEIIHRTQPLPLTRKIQIVEEVSAGLEYAHKFGMVHRDINPSNIVVTSDGVAKILAFGTFRAAETQITQDGMIPGAVNYLSPEQVKGSPIDGRSDVFALGTVLYEVITGRKAFPGNLSTGVLEHIIADEPKPLDSPVLARGRPAASLVPGLPVELERIIGNSLKKDPSQRYQDAGLMRRDLSRVRLVLEEERGRESDPVTQV